MEHSSPNAHAIRNSSRHALNTSIAGNVTKLQTQEPFNRDSHTEVNKSQIRSLKYVLNNTFRKIFATKSFDVATEYVLYFGCAVQVLRRHFVEEKVNF